MVGQPGLHVGACPRGKQAPSEVGALPLADCVVSCCCAQSTLLLGQKKHGRAWNNCREQMPAAFPQPP